MERQVHRVRTCKSGGAGGFTLIELLVVVAIIALLISILLPSLTNARQVARMVKCQAILKQFGTANHIYANDHEDWFLAMQSNGFGRWYQNIRWRSLLSMTPGSTYPPDLVCPNVPSDRPAGHGNFNIGHNIQGVPNEPLLKWHEGDYKVNATATDNRPGRRVFRAKIKTPSSKIQAADASHSWIHRTGANWQNAWDLFPETNPSFPQFGGAGVGSQVSYRHDEGANLLMFDAHVEWRHKSQVIVFTASNSLNNTVNQALWDVYR